MLTSVLLLLFACCEAQSGPPPRDLQPVAGSAVVSGRVTDRETGQPLPRMVVTLVKADRSSRIEVVTNGEGRYEATGLSAGAYAVSAAPDEHRATYLVQRYGDPTPTILALRPDAPNLEVKDGEIRSGVDLALWRAMAIEGRLTDPWDEPMSEVAVEVGRADDGFHVAAPVYSDDRGNYRFYGLPPGRYRVCANARGGMDEDATGTARFVRTCYPAVVADSQASDVVVTNADVGGIDIRVQRVGAFSIAGTVVDAAGDPVDGASVGASALERSGASASTVSRGGEFVLKGLTPGRYRVTASIGASRTGRRGSPERAMEMGFVTVDVAGGDTTGVAVALSKGATIAGSVIFEGNPPRAERLRISVLTTGERFGPMVGEPPVGAVNHDRRFELTDIFRQPLVVHVQGLPDGWVVKSIRREGQEIMHVPTVFGTGAPVERIEILVTNRVARPSVRVVQETGTPAVSYHVVAVPANPASWRQALTIVRGTHDGLVPLGALLPGDYLLAALPDTDLFELMRDPTRIESIASVGRRASFTEAGTSTIELPLITLEPRR